jgi:DNA-binding transcriptional regulator YiaG
MAARKAKKKATRKKTARKKANGKSVEGEFIPGKGGRPTKFRNEFIEEAFRLALLGISDAKIAEALEVTETTVNNWKIKHPAFFESIRRGKTLADSEIAHALYVRAKGCSTTDVRVVLEKDGEGVRQEVRREEFTKHHPPDTKAASLWLRNRQRENWREEKHVLSQRPLEELTWDELEELRERLEREKQALLGHDGGAENQ